MADQEVTLQIRGRREWYLLVHELERREWYLVWSVEIQDRAIAYRYRASFKVCLLKRMKYNCTPTSFFSGATLGPTSPIHVVLWVQGLVDPGLQITLFVGNVVGERVACCEVEALIHAICCVWCVRQHGDAISNGVAAVDEAIWSIKSYQSKVDPFFFSNVTDDRWDPLFVSRLTLDHDPLSLYAGCLKFVWK